MPAIKFDKAFRKTKQQKGFTLLELMIAIILGLITVAAATTLYITTIQGSTVLARSARLNNDLSMILQTMTNDLRRAGYWGGATADVDPSLNPHITDADIAIPTSDCIVYSYDALEDATSTAAATELFGFRLSNGAIEIRTAATTFSSCNDADGTWVPMTLLSSGESLTITDLEFSFEAMAASGSYPSLAGTSNCDNIDDSVTAPDPSADCLGGVATAPTSGQEIAVRRVVNIRLTGQSSIDDDIQKVVGTSVVVANDLVRVLP